MTLYSHQDGNESDEYATKPELWRPLADSVGGFDLDPASGIENEHIAETVYTKQDDGLAQSWFGNVWLNPPFSEKTAWFKKCVNELNAGNVDTIVALAPVDTSTQWFQNWYSQAGVICWLEGRDWYVASGSPSFNTTVAVFGECPTDTLRVLEGKGVVTETVETGTQETLL